MSNEPRVAAVNQRALIVQGPEWSQHRDTWNPFDHNIEVMGCLSFMKHGMKYLATKLQLK